MKSIKIVTLFLVSTTLASCMFDGFGIKGNGNVVTEDRKVTSEFKELEVSEGIEVFLTQGVDNDIKVEVDENIIDLLITKVSGDILEIYFKENVSRTTSKKVYLTTYKLTRIKTSSGSKITNHTPFKTKVINLESSSGSLLELNLKASEIISTSSSGANVKISGTTESFSGSASSGSRIEANKLSSKISNTKVSSGANISIQVSEELNAQANSGGKITYNRNPTILNTSKSSGGKISKH